MLPDVDGEAAAAGYRVLIGAFQSDGGFGSSADFTAENHRLPERAHHVRQRVEEFWSHCAQEASAENHPHLDSVQRNTFKTSPKSYLPG